MTSKKVPHYTKIPNNYIHSDTLKEYGVSRKFYIVYVLIDRHKSYDNISWLTIKKILSQCGSKICNVRSRDTQYKEVINILEYMQEIDMIQIITDLSTIRNDSCIELIVTKDKVETNFTSITSDEFEKITSIQSSVSVENLISTFLYIKSYIFKRSLKKDGTEPDNVKQHPEAFFTKAEKICEDTAIARETLNRCLVELVKNGLLVKHEVGSYVKTIKNKKQIENSPNIYVLNNLNAKQEITWALDKLKSIYKVDSFYPILRKKVNTDNKQDDL